MLPFCFHDVCDNACVKLFLVKILILTLTVQLVILNLRMSTALRPITCQMLTKCSVECGSTCVKLFVCCKIFILALPVSSTFHSPAVLTFLTSTSLVLGVCVCECEWKKSTFLELCFVAFFKFFIPMIRSYYYSMKTLLKILETGTISCRF